MAITINANIMMLFLGTHFKKNCLECIVYHIYLIGLPPTLEKSHSLFNHLFKGFFEMIVMEKLQKKLMVSTPHPMKFKNVMAITDGPSSSCLDSVMRLKLNASAAI